MIIYYSSSESRAPGPLFRGRSPNGSAQPSVSALLITGQEPGGVLLLRMRYERKRIAVLGAVRKLIRGTSETR